MEKKEYSYIGPVGDNLKKKKKQGRKGWMVPIEDLEAAISVYRNVPNDEEDEVGGKYNYVVFSVNGPDLCILGVNKEEVDNPATKSSSNSPRDPGEFNQFPPWPPG